MMRFAGPTSIVLVALAATACTNASTDDEIGKKQQAVVAGCHLSTVGAACDPDDDGPLGFCDGTCVILGGPAGGAACMPYDQTLNEGLPCGELQSDHVDCNRSCRAGVCTTDVNADDGSPCMPSGATYVSAICEGACSAGTCIKLYHPKRCGGTDDGGTGGDDGGTSGGDGGGGGGGDGGVTLPEGGIWIPMDTGTGGGSGGDAGGGGTGDDGGGGGTGDDTGNGANGGGSGDDGGGLPWDGGTPPPVDGDGGIGAGDDGGVGWWKPIDLGGDTGGGGTGGDDGGIDQGADSGLTPDNPAADGNTGDTGGCGCRTTRSTSSTGASIAASIALAFVIARRRRSIARR